MPWGEGGVASLIYARFVILPCQLYSRNRNLIGLETLVSHVIGDAHV